MPVCRVQQFCYEPFVTLCTGLVIGGRYASATLLQGKTKPGAFNPSALMTKEDMMNALVVYDSQYGNTERIAQTIADTLRTFGEVRAIRADPAHPVGFQGVDMLIVGCPTQGWRPTRAIQSFLDGTSPEQFRGMAVACFDTRFQKSRWLTGSAATVMAKKLRKTGVELLAPPESFFVQGTEGPLNSGELERAAVWARMLHNRVETPHPVMQR